jgi:hypothetical protein
VGHLKVGLKLVNWLLEGLRLKNRAAFEISGVWMSPLPTSCLISSVDYVRPYELLKVATSHSGLPFSSAPTWTHADHITFHGRSDLSLLQFEVMATR